MVNICGRVWDDSELRIVEEILNNSNNNTDRGKEVAIVNEFQCTTKQAKTVIKYIEK